MRSAGSPIGATRAKMRRARKHTAETGADDSGRDIDEMGWRAPPRPITVVTSYGQIVTRWRGTMIMAAISCCAFIA
jgi:hypothetical protein